MSTTQIPVEKTFVYSICDLLINKKLTYPIGKGIRRPIAIPLQEFTAEHFHGTKPQNLNDAQIGELKQELQDLIDEGNLLKVKNPQIFKRFKNAFGNNESVVLVYTRLDLKKFKEMLKDGDSEYVNGSGLRFDPDNQLLFYDGKSYYIPSISIRGQICRLLFNHPIHGTENDILPIGLDPEYALGNWVNNAELYDLIFGRPKLDTYLPEKMKQIYDAVRGINQQAQKKLQIKILEQTEQQVRLILPR